jgi:hypothetical protein
MNAGFAIKVKAEYDLGQWTLTTTDPKIEVTADEFHEAMRDLLKEINEKFIKTFNSQSRISVMQGEIKAAISQSIGLLDLTRSALSIPMEDMKISTSIVVRFSRDRTLDEFTAASAGTKKAGAE